MGSADGYVLGVDLGTTYSSAAVADDGRATTISLGTRTATIPSVVTLRVDGDVLVGEAAERRALTEPSRTAREFKRRLGDPVPFLLGGTPYGAEALTAHLLRWIVSKVTEQEGARPDRVVVSHPANWGPYKLELLTQAVRMADVEPVSYLAEPVAAAIHYAQLERFETGGMVAVYDFGGGTFDAAVLRTTEDGFTIVGTPEGLERIGGIDFDQAVLDHVDRALDGAVRDAGDDPGALAAVVRLREECQAAKETLSQDTDVDIPVLLPRVQTEVRLTRGEFEDMIRPRVLETLAALERAVRSAGAGMDDMDRILLVGGSSRIPLVGQLIRERTGRPLALDAHPKDAIALGAAMSGYAQLAAPEPTASEPAAPEHAAPAGPAAAPTPAPVPVAPDPATAASAPATAGQAPEPAAAVPTPPAPAQVPPAPPAPPAEPRTGILPEPPPRPARRVPAMAVGAGVGALVAIVALVLLLTRGGPEDAAASAASASSAADGAAAAASPSPEPSTATSSEEAWSEPTSGETSDTSPDDPPTAGLPGGRYVEITGITLQGDRYAVDYETYNYTPKISDNDGDYHIHFFFDTVAPENAGTNGPDPAEWILYDGPVPFTGYGPADRPPGADKICALVANHLHEIAMYGGRADKTGNCVDLPTG